MDNRLKRDLVKFFKKMNKTNLALLKDNKNAIKDIDKIKDEEKLIREGLKQCDFIVNYFTSNGESQTPSKTSKAIFKPPTSQRPPKQEARPEPRQEQPQPKKEKKVISTKKRPQKVAPKIVQREPEPEPEPMP